MLRGICSKRETTARFNKILSRLIRFLSKKDAGLVRQMDNTLQGTWMANKQVHPPKARVRLNRNRIRVRQSLVGVRPTANG